MAKSNNKRKRTNHALFHAVKARMNGEAEKEPSVQAEPTAIQDPTEDFVLDSDLATTMQTLEKLVANPSLFHSKRCKNLRRILHPLVIEQLQSYDKGIDYRHKVTQSLQHQQWADALAALQACHDFQQYPKQGTVQRWVRDCTGAGGCQMALLQAILKLNTTTTSASNAGDGNKHDPAQAWSTHLASNPDSKDELVIMEGWKWWDNETAQSNDDKAQQDIENEKASSSPPSVIASPTTIDASKITANSRIVYRESAAERTPPNHYDLLLHATEQGSIDWSNSSPPSTTAMHPIPFLPQPSRVLSNVLSPNECQQLLQVTTALGFRQDHPIALAQPTGIDSCEWMVDDSILMPLFQRVKSHLPATLTIGSRTVQLHGMNPRWRCFRYGQDCVYRPHLDGSWPLCYMKDDTYVCPQQPQQHPSVIKSYLTFLLYLNDDFEGGETRFYLPQGVARGVVPKAGSVTVFPQGNTASLIHEGSQVTRGTKFVIRTDVLYRPVLVSGADDDDDEEHVVMEGNDDDEEEP